jgi:hypothetical protein
MKAEEILPGDLPELLRGSKIRGKVYGDELIKGIELLPDKWSELIFSAIKERWNEEPNLERLSPVLVAAHMFLCGWNKTVPAPWRKIERTLDMRNDPEWDEYCRLSEKFSNWE